MKQFFEEIRAKEKNLSIEDEYNLFNCIYTGNTQAREDIFFSNLRFAIYFAKKYYGYGMMHEQDLIQVASMGLYSAIDTFDNNKGVKFISYARWEIHKEVNKYLTDNKNTIRLPAHLNEGIFYPSSFSYDEIIGNDDENDFSTKLAFLEDKSKPLDLETSNNNIDSILSDMEPFEQTIIKQRIFEDKTYKEIQVILKKKHKIIISRDKVRYTFEKLMKKLSKKYSKKEFIDLFI